MLVAVPGWNLELLREALTPEEMPRVRLRDMTVAGRNPGRIIGTVLTAFVREHADRRVRIVGEPIWAGRTDEEYPACAEHEALINVALGESPAYIQCPYDTAKLPSSVLTDATRTHPTLASPVERWTSPTYTDPGAVAASFDTPLAPTPNDAEFVVIGSRTGARTARVLVHDAGRMHGMDADRLTDVRLVAQELAVNTLTHSPDGPAACWRCGRRTTTSSCRSRTAAGSPTRWSDAARRSRRTSATGCSSSTSSPTWCGSTASRRAPRCGSTSACPERVGLRPSGSPPPARTGPSR